MSTHFCRFLKLFLLINIQYGDVLGKRSRYIASVSQWPNLYLQEKVVVSICQVLVVASVFNNIYKERRS